MIRIIPNLNLEQQPLEKLEKINHIYCEIIADREKHHQIAGTMPKPSRKGFRGDFLNQFRETMGKILMEADKTIKERPGDLIGTRYMIAVLRALPLDDVKRGQIAIAKAIKKIKELKRQQLDQGNLDKLIREA